MKHQTSSMESYRNPIAPTVHKALSPGAFQHFCDVHNATFNPTGITGAHLASSSLLSHVFLKEVGAPGLREKLMPENCLFGYQPSCFQMSEADPAPTRLSQGQHSAAPNSSFAVPVLLCACGFLLTLWDGQALAQESKYGFLTSRTWPLICVSTSPYLSRTSWTTVCLTPFHLAEIQVLAGPLSWPA